MRAPGGGDGIIDEAARFTLGAAVLSGIVLCLGARPAWVPALYLVLAAVGLPLRVWRFIRRGYAFFLIDYCYVSA